MMDHMPRKDAKLPPLIGQFKPSIIGPGFLGDTEIIMQDCPMVWERWDEKTEVAKTPEGLLVGVRLIGYNSTKESSDVQS